MTSSPKRLLLEFAPSPSNFQSATACGEQFFSEKKESVSRLTPSSRPTAGRHRNQETAECQNLTGPHRPPGRDPDGSRTTVEVERLWFHIGGIRVKSGTSAGT